MSTDTEISKIRFRGGSKLSRTARKAARSAAAKKAWETRKRLYPPDGVPGDDDSNDNLKSKRSKISEALRRMKNNSERGAASVGNTPEEMKRRSEARRKKAAAARKAKGVKKRPAKKRPSPKAPAKKAPAKKAPSLSTVGDWSDSELDAELEMHREVHATTSSPAEKRVAANAVRALAEEKSRRRVATGKNGSSLKGYKLHGVKQNKHGRWGAKGTDSRGNTKTYWGASPEEAKWALESMIADPIKLDGDLRTGPLTARPAHEEDWPDIQKKTRKGFASSFDDYMEKVGWDTWVARDSSGKLVTIDSPEELVRRWTNDSAPAKKPVQKAPATKRKKAMPKAGSKGAAAAEKLTEKRKAAPKSAAPKKSGPPAKKRTKRMGPATPESYEARKVESYDGRSMGSVGTAKMTDGSTVYQAMDMEGKHISDHKTEKAAFNAVLRAAPFTRHGKRRSTRSSGGKKRQVITPDKDAQLEAAGLTVDRRNGTVRTKGGKPMTAAQKKAYEDAITAEEDARLGYGDEPDADPRKELRSKRDKRFEKFDTKISAAALKGMSTADLMAELRRASGARKTQLQREILKRKKKK